MCGKAPGSKEPGCVCRDAQEGKKCSSQKLKPRASLACRSRPQVWLDPDPQDSIALSDFSTRDIIEKEEKSG